MRGRRITAIRGSRRFWSAQTAALAVSSVGIHNAFVGFRFLHAADVHLDSPMQGLQRYEGAPVELWRGATRHALVNLVDLAIVEQVAFVALAGDLYDGDWKDYQTGLFFIEQLHRLRQARIRVFVVAGNHDAAAQITRSLRLPDNVHAFATTAPESIVVDELDLAVHGQGFAHRAVTDNLAAAYPRSDKALFHLGLLHTAVEGRPGHAPYAPCTLEQLRHHGYGYWALGHVHQSEVLCTDPWVVFPGNTQGRHARECGAKGCRLVRVDDGQVTQVEHRSLDVARWAHCQVDATECATADDVLERLRARLHAELAAAQGRPIAARLQLSLPASLRGTRWHNQERWLHEARAMSGGFDEGRLWIEKVSVELGAAAATQSAEHGAALEEVRRSLRQLGDAPAQLQALTQQLATLRQRLPAELWQGDDATDPLSRDPLGVEALRAALADAELLLLQGLQPDR